MNFSARLRAAFLTSVADLFFGAAAILIILIVLARPTDERRVQRYVDVELTCETATDGGWLVAEKNASQPLKIKQWLKTKARGALLLRTGVWVSRNQMDCYRVFKKASRQHNSRLTRRGTIGASVAPIMLPRNKDQTFPTAGSTGKSL